MSQVKIGPNFFAKAKNDYTDWRWAVVREALQNCLDAPGCRRIEISIYNSPDGTWFEFQNDGEPMTRDVLENKLLALGESSKDGCSTVGGFGKAKEVLYFCHKRYTIRTGRYYVTGCGGDYQLTEDSTSQACSGTYSRVLIDGNEQAALTAHAKAFAAMCNWSGTMIINGTEVETKHRLGTKRREFDWATIYTNNSCPNRLIIRIRGAAASIPMFSRYINYHKTVVVEMKASSLTVLSANRDALRWAYQEKLDSFVADLTVDKRSALIQREPVYTHFEGERIKTDTKVQMQELVAAAYATHPANAPADEDADEENGQPLAAVTSAAYADPTKETHERAAGRCSCNFVVRNTTGMQIPDYYKPGQFGSYSKKLVTLWIKCLTELHRVMGRSDSFSVGFVFDSDYEAMHERTNRYGRVYYINPAVITSQKNSQSRSMRKRWKFNAEGKYAILAIALHEFVHADIGPHNEDYAGQLTKLTGVAFAKIAKLRKALQ